MKRSLQYNNQRLRIAFIMHSLSLLALSTITMSYGNPLNNSLNAWVHQQQDEMEKDYNSSHLYKTDTGNLLSCTLFQCWTMCIASGFQSSCCKVCTEPSCNCGRIYGPLQSVTLEPLVGQHTTESIESIMHNFKEREIFGAEQELDFDYKVHTTNFNSQPFNTNFNKQSLLHRLVDVSHNLFSYRESFQNSLIKYFRTKYNVKSVNITLQDFNEISHTINNPDRASLFRDSISPGTPTFSKIGNIQHLFSHMEEFTLDTIQYMYNTYLTFQETNINSYEIAHDFAITPFDVVGNTTLELPITDGRPGYLFHPNASDTFFGFTFQEIPYIRMWIFRRVGNSLGFEYQVAIAFSNLSPDDQLTFIFEIQETPRLLLQTLRFKFPSRKQLMPTFYNSKDPISHLYQSICIVGGHKTFSISTEKRVANRVSSYLMYLKLNFKF